MDQSGAGVGIATLYRHFPTREALVRALVEDSLAIEDITRIFYAISGVVEAGDGPAWRRVLELHLREMAFAGPPLPELG